jgi:hypothetical protein
VRHGEFRLKQRKSGAFRHHLTKDFLGRGRKRDRRDVSLIIEEKPDRPIQLIHCGVNFSTARIACS